MDAQDAGDSGSVPSDNIQQADQSGGVNVFGGTNAFQGDVVGRDKFDYSVEAGLTVEALNQLFLPLIQSLESIPVEKRPEAQEKVQILKEEVAKGKDAEDSRIAKLVDGIIELVPSAVSAITGMFATPILSGIAGPVTKFVLDKIRSK